MESGPAQAVPDPAVERPLGPGRETGVDAILDLGELRAGLAERYATWWKRLVSTVGLVVVRLVVAPRRRTAGMGTRFG